jgi:hypothetical protein
MLPITAVESLGRDRRQALLDEAARDRLQAICRAPGRRRLGWLLVRAGVWLARADIVGTDGSIVPVRLVR